MSWARLFVILLGLPLLAWLIAYGDWPLAAGLGMLALLGYREFSRAVRRKGLFVVREVGYAVCLGFIIAAQIFSAEELADALLGVLFLGLVASLSVYGWRSSEGSAIAHVGTTVLGCLYVGLGLSFWVLLRALPGPVGVIWGYPIEYGAQLLGLTVVATWGAECLTGFLHGRNQLAEADQVEKLVGWRVAVLGFAVALGITVWGGTFLGISLLPRGILGALIGVAGMGGQRTKRALQREAGITQFDALLSGHASVLAYFSGLLWTVPVAYFYAMLWL